MFLKKKIFRKLFNSFSFPFLFVITIIFCFVICENFNIDNSTFGIYPRDRKSLFGIFTMVFVHSGVKHLFNNIVPLFILGSLLFYFYNEVAMKVWIYSILYGGILLWLGGRASYHIGASGLVYALSSFIFLSGILRKNNKLKAISLCIIFLYGGLIWGIFPTYKNISWEGHLFGFINGIFWSLYFKNIGPKKDMYSWDKEEEVLKELDGIDIKYEIIE